MVNFINFADALVKAGILTSEAVERLENEAKKFHTTFEQQLVTQKLMGEEDIAKHKAKFADLPYVELGEVETNQEVMGKISEDVATHYRVISFRKENDEIHVGLVDPENYAAIEAVEFLAKEHHWRVKFFVVSASSFYRLVKKYRMLGKEVKEVVDAAEEKFKGAEKELTKDQQSMEEVIRNAPVSKMVSMIMRYAVDNKASDIHIEPQGNQSWVRFRIDGDLKKALVLPGDLHNAIVARIKVLANLKLDETRVPQDGRIRFDVDEGKSVDLRLSTLPLTGKEKIVMRVLDTTKGVPTMKGLGFRPRYVEIMERNISKPHGLFLITGPTGSGKSTTLYAALNSVNSEDVNIITMEDPVEYSLPGINQSQVNPDVGLTFAAGLRAILRQDPDVIMVGEIRDQETGELAIHAGLTGHLVFSTLHTNDAFGAIPRFVDMGAQPFLLVSTLNLVMAQRLVRTICDKCKIEEDLPENLKKEIDDALKTIPEVWIKDQFPQGMKDVKYYKGKGCPRCNNTGYKGRTTVAEFIEMTDQLKKIVVDGNDPEKIMAEIKRQEMMSMKQDGMLKVVAGITTMEEVVAVTTS